jgi:DNA-directed RNA polymerase specialized sigma24 family protein
MRDPINRRRRPGRDELNPESFEALLRFLHPDRDQAGVLYVELRRTLSRFFASRGFGWCEDLVDVSIARVAGQLAQGLRIRSRSHFGYFRGVADKVAREEWRRERRRRKVQESLAPTMFERECELDARLEALEICLDHLAREQRDLFESYHLCEDRIRGRRELAQRLGLPLNALRIRVHRVRVELETRIEARVSGPRNASACHGTSG